MHFAFVILPLITSLASCQQLLQFGNGELPNCAQSCSTLQSAQTGCIPAGGAPVSNPQTYKSCFCNSALLTELKSGSAPTLCASNCGDTTTRNQIATWYNSYCASGQLPQAGSNSGSSGDGTSGNTQASGGSLSSSSSSSSGNGSTASYNPGSWWDQHARWIAMAIVLIVGFALIIAGGLWYKKRYYSKRERALSLGQPSSWGPTRGATYPSSEKFGQSDSPTASPDPNRNSRQGKRLSKLVGR